MKSDLNIYTSFVTKENLVTVIENFNMLPIFILRSIRNSELIGEYSGSAIHFRNLSPTSPLYQAWRDGLIDFNEYKKRFLIELSEIKLYEVIKKFENLCDISEASGVVLFAYGEDPELSHRKILSDFINSSGVLEKPIIEFNYDEKTTIGNKNSGGCNK